MERAKRRLKMPCTKHSKLKKATNTLSRNVSSKKVKMPAKQVQQKTQFRQCKDFLITDFKPKFKLVDSKSLDAALNAYVEERFPNLMSTLSDLEQ